MLERTSLQTAAMTNVLDSLLATNEILVLESPGIQLRSTLGKATRVDAGVLQENRTLSGFSLDIVAGMSRRHAGKAKHAGSKDIFYMNHGGYT